MTGNSAPPRLTADLILQAYQIGYFPMADDAKADEIFWVRPDIRGVIFFDEFHLSKSLRKSVRQDRYRITINTNFLGVMAGCAMPQTGRRTTWINEEITNAYNELNRLGCAHSVEAWEGDQLVGGLYGVSIGAGFFGESMFSTHTDASKICLVHLVARLMVGKYQFLDTQFQNDHLTQFGTQEVLDTEYQSLLEKSLASKGDFFALPRQVRGSIIVQSITQTS